MANKQITSKIKSLCFIFKDSKILLGLKKRGFAEGKWNGFGGKVEDSESIEDAVKRELVEEAAVIVKNLDHLGVLTFQGNDQWDIVTVHVFRCDKFDGVPQESEEMKPHWFEIKDIPYDKMLEDEKYWLPLLLRDKKFRGKFIYDRKNNMISHQVVEL